MFSCKCLLGARTYYSFCLVSSPDNFLQKMFVLLGLGFKSEHFSCVMPSLFTKVLMLFICLYMFIELLVGYICEILGVGVYWD